MIDTCAKNENGDFILNAAALDILSVVEKNGEIIVQLRDGSQKLIQNSGDAPVTIQLSSGELYTSQDMTALFAMGTPEEIYTDSIEEATYTAYQEEQTQKEAAEEKTNIEPAAGEEGEGTEEAMMEQLAEELAEVETAAGDDGGGAGSNGFGFNSSFSSQAIEQIDDVGALQRTQLQYGVDAPQDDSSDLNNPEPIQPTLELLDPNTGLALDGGYQVLEDGTIQMLLRATPDSDNGIMTITIVGIPPSWTVSGDGTYNANTQTWTITTQQGQVFTGGPIVTPPADSDVDLPNLKISVTEFDPDTGLRGTASTSAEIIVDAVADTPDIDAQDTVGLEDTAVDVKIIGAPGDKDGSETIQKFVVSGVPEGFNLNAGTNLGNGSWELSPQQIQGLKLTGSHNFYGDVPLTVTIHTAETVTDRDFDLTNNTAQASDTVVVSFIPAADPPTVRVDLPHGDECGCPDNDGLVAQVYEDNAISVDFSATRDPSASPTEFLIVTVSGVDLTKLDPNSFTISGQGNAIWTRVAGSPDMAASFTITLPAGTDYDGKMTFKPLANSDIDLSGIKVMAVAHEPASKSTADSNVETFDVIVDAVADKPLIVAEDALLSTGKNSILLNIMGGIGSDQDNSESITHYQIKGVPNGFTFNQGTTIGNGVWHFTPMQMTDLKIISQDPAFAGKLDLTAVVFTKDTPNDKDFDTTNNTNFSEDKFSVTWNAPPDAVDDAYQLVEHGLGSVDVNDITGGATLIKLGTDNQDGHYYKLPILGNDSDPNNDALKIVRIFNISNPRVNSDISISEDGQYMIVRLGQDNRQSKSNIIDFDYEITDGNGGYDIAHVRINVKDLISPLVFDLDGDGVELINSTNGVLFDLDNDGEAEKVGWAGSDDGLLAMDVNGDGIINNQTELFGNTAEHDTGFAKLASFDINADGVINTTDGVFANLVIWQDANTNGFSEAGEMFTLTDLNIASISLTSQQVSKIVNGNIISDIGKFTYTDGTTGEVVDAWFDSKEVVTSNHNNTMTGTEFADTFVFAAGNIESDTVIGFNSDEGDVLDISALLDDGFDPLQDAINEFVFATATDDGSTVLSFDVNGSGNPEAAVQFAVLQGITASVEDLKESFITA